MFHSGSVETCVYVALPTLRQPDSEPNWALIRRSSPSQLFEFLEIGAII